MRKNNTKIEKYRDKAFEIRIYGQNGDNYNGVFRIKFENKDYFVIASNGKDWEHISVSGKNIPNWKTMCFIKDLFFDENETVIQFHPKKSEYVNKSETCLHLWKPINKEIELPENILV